MAPFSNYWLWIVLVAIRNLLVFCSMLLSLRKFYPPLPCYAQHYCAYWINNNKTKQYIIYRRAINQTNIHRSIIARMWGKYSIIWILDQYLIRCFEPSHQTVHFFLSSIPLSVFYYLSLSLALLYCPWNYAADENNIQCINYWLVNLFNLRYTTMQQVLP